MGGGNLIRHDFHKKPEEGKAKEGQVEAETGKSDRGGENPLRKRVGILRAGFWVEGELGGKPRVKPDTNSTRTPFLPTSSD